MKFKVFIQVFSLLLAINFANEVILTTSAITLAQVEIDLDADAEKKEPKNEKESDKINQGHLFSKFESRKERDLSAVHYGTCWISPTIEMSSPPPELG